MSDALEMQPVEGRVVYVLLLAGYIEKRPEPAWSVPAL